MRRHKEGDDKLPFDERGRYLMIVKCKDCKKSFEIDPDKPLPEQGFSRHVLHMGTKYGLRHMTQDEYAEMMQEKEVGDEWQIP